MDFEVLSTFEEKHPEITNSFYSALNKFKSVAAKNEYFTRNLTFTLDDMYVGSDDVTFYVLANGICHTVSANYFLVIKIDNHYAENYRLTIYKNIGCLYADL